MKKIKIGIIGTGVGIRTILPGFRQNAMAEVVGITGRTKERSLYFAKQYNIPRAYDSYEQMCNDDNIDLICVCSPNNYHFTQVKYAIKSGKHVLCEKPLTCKREEVLDLIELSRNTNKYCIIDHQLRFNPYIRKIKEILDSKEIGKPYFIRIHQQSMAFANQNANWSWSFDDAQNGGVRWAMGVHFIDLLLFLLQEDMYNISGNMNPVIMQRADDKQIIRNIKASTLCTASMISESGIDIKLSVTAAAFSEPRFDIDIYGEKGEMHFDLVNKIQVFLENEKKQLDEIQGVYNDEKQNKVSIFSGSFRYFAPLILNAILLKDKKYLKDAASFESALYTYDILEDIKIASQENCIVKPLNYRREYI